MEPEGLLPCSQEPAACLYPEPDQSSLGPVLSLLQIQFNIILPFTPLSSKMSLSLSFFQLKPYMYLFFHPYFFGLFIK